MFSTKTKFKTNCFRHLFIMVLLSNFQPAFAAWEFGRYSLETNSARANSSLSVKARGRDGLTSLDFVTTVGGINFENIAKVNEIIDRRNISIFYHSEKVDGERLKVEIDDKSFYPFIYDWQLAPIAKYADSENTAIVTLFGKGDEPGKYYYIDYHEAFANTVMGLRLLHADILLMDPYQFRTLPKSNRKMVMENGEYERDELKSRNAAIELSRHLKDNEYRSWVLTDVGTSSEVSIEDGNFTVIANPYYYFWQLEKKRIPTLFGNTYFSSPKVVPADAITNLIREKKNIIWKVNPYVTDVVEKTASYSAFFRYIKNNNRKNWKRFISDIKRARVRQIKTPNQWKKDISR
ncbi:MAG: hypothetical protein OEY38_05990 [Gammaproteobacteria bacterium]|nr:hypothetical protein [Gammaproteobacteria bacterium]